MNPSTRATAAAVTAVTLAASGYFGFRWLAVAVLAATFFLAIGWPALTWTPNWLIGSSIVLVGGALASVGVLLGEDEPFLRHMVVALAAVAVLALVLEIIFPSPPGQVVTAVASTVSGAAVAAAGAAWIAAARTPGSEDLVVAGAAALFVAAIASTLTSIMWINTLLAIAFGTGIGGASGTVFESIEWYGGALVGLLCACAFVCIHELARRDTLNTSTLAAISSGIASVTLAGSFIYVGGRIGVG
ncbi:MAG: hypothetical protein JW722_07095 [Demequinaceae bacterium]|nr:hypothetical protein [Demequinaceae bacterium]